jgi:hypothetical protein
MPCRTTAATTQLAHRPRDTWIESKPALRLVTRPLNHHR